MINRCLGIAWGWVALAALGGCGSPTGGENVAGQATEPWTTGSLPGPAMTGSCIRIAGVDPNHVAGKWWPMSNVPPGSGHDPSILAFLATVYGETPATVSAAHIWEVSTGAGEVTGSSSSGALVMDFNPHGTGVSTLWSFGADVSWADPQAMAALANDPANQAAPVNAGLFTCTYNWTTPPPPDSPSYPSLLFVVGGTYPTTLYAPPGTPPDWPQPGACGHGCY